ncbi:hypothetical protein ACWC9H_06190 [Streptomyces sp. NPDC001251]
MHRKQLATGVRMSAMLIAVGLPMVGCGGSDTAPISKVTSSHAATPDLATPLNFAQIKQVVELQSMPIGWKPGAQPLSGRDVPKDAPCRKPSGVCAGETSTVVVQYNNADNTGNVYLEVHAYEDREAARAGYQSRSASSNDKSYRQISMPTVGNASVARTGVNVATGDPFTAIVMRVDTVAALVVYTHEGKVDPPMLLSLARLEAERIQQVQRGGKPTATLSNQEG